MTTITFLYGISTLMCYKYDITRTTKVLFHVRLFSTLIIMEDPEDLSMDRLELCSYRYLQQMAKSYGFPSNVKKMYLIEMINARKYRSKEELEAIVAKIKDERKQLLKVRKPPKRKKKYLQGTEISSTSNQSSRASDYVITYPPSPNRQAVTVMKYRQSNKLHPTIAKKTIDSDRVLRSFNNKVRRDYSIFNANNSFVRVIKAQKSLQQTDDVQERQYSWSVAFQNRSPLNISDSTEQKHVPTSYEEFSRLNGDFQADEDRQLVPIPRSFNISPKPVKHLRSIYPLKPPRPSHYQYLPCVELRRQDGRISKINAMVPTSILKKIPENFTNTRTSIVRQLAPQISNVRNDARQLAPQIRNVNNVVRQLTPQIGNVRNDPRPNCSKTNDLDYKIDLSNSSTESAIDSGTENISVQKNLKTYAETKKRATVSLIKYDENQKNRSVIRYSKSSSLIAENFSKYGESRQVTENLNKYTQYRKQTAGTATELEKALSTVASKPMENKSYAAKNLNRKAENRRFFTVKTNKQQCNRSLTAVNPNRQTENHDFASTNLNRYATNNNRAIENRYRQSESRNNATENVIENRSQTVDNTNKYIDFASYTHATPNRYVETRNLAIENQNRYLESMNHATVNPIKDKEIEYWAAKNLIRYKEMGRRTGLTRHTDIRTPENTYTETVNHPINNTRGYTETVNHPLDNSRGYTESVNYAIDNTRGYTEAVNYPIDNTRGYTEAVNHPIDNTRGYTEAVNHPIDNTRGYTETVNQKNVNRYIGNGNYVVDHRNTITESRSYSESPMIYTESRNYIEIPERSTEIENFMEHSDINTNFNEEIGWNAARNYSNKHALSDIYPENQANEHSMNPSSCSVYYHKMREEQVRSQSSYTPQNRRTDNEKLPRIADAFSHFNNAQYRSLTQPLYIQISEQSERTVSPSTKAGIVLEQLYNFTGRLLSTSNEPLLQVVTTNNTVCVYSTHVMTSAGVNPPATASNDCNTHLFERDSQYNLDSENVPRLYDYLKIAEQERRYFKCNEVLNSSDSSFGTSASAQAPHPGANVTIPEMVEDALELISQDGDYMERIGMDDLMKCFKCDWAGPKITLEYHFKEKHLSSITDQPSPRWATSFRLGQLRGSPRATSRHRGRLYVLAASVKLGTLKVALTVIPTASDEIPKYCCLTAYNKVTGEPQSWEGEILDLTDTEPFDEQTNGLKLDITSLNLLPNSANLNLINGELVADSMSKVIIGQPELDDIEIDIHVQVFD